MDNKLNKKDLICGFVGSKKIPEYHINLEKKGSCDEIIRILQNSGLTLSSYDVIFTRGYSMQHSVRFKTKKALSKLHLIEDYLLTIEQALEVTSKSIYYPVVQKLLQSLKVN